MKYPWNDYSRRLSPLKLTVFVALFAPGLWTAVALASGSLGARPLNEAIHQIGLWTIRLIVVALAITPLKAVLQWQRLILARRMVGVAACAYVLIHFSLYVVDESFDLKKVASEIVLRIYLTIGFTALVGLCVLAATSTDGMVRRLGRRWQTLHRLVYLVALLGLIHYFMQSKLEVWEPTIFFGIYGWLMGYRLLAWKFAVRGRLGLGWIAALGVAVTVLTGVGEAIYFYLAFPRVPTWRVIEANWSLVTGIRPAAVVLALAAAVVLAGLIRNLTAPASRLERGGRAMSRL
ncbi:MAG TPA: protein-methionine-sulfoxide reductase heme-binding subunit MsrQ [Stellaceae bacterium]|nr:protein-methionine-sulfoxide reductase heme-binding subunit MsrQ [Stellaceae bacterium]